MKENLTESSANGAAQSKGYRLLVTYTDGLEESFLAQTYQVKAGTLLISLGGEVTSIPQTGIRRFGATPVILTMQAPAVEPTPARSAPDVIDMAEKDPSDGE